MTPLTPQQVLDRNWQWFIVEKHPQSLNEDRTYKSCQYLTPSGNRCAIGCCLIGHDDIARRWDSFASSGIDKLLRGEFNSLGEQVQAPDEDLPLLFDVTDEDFLVDIQEAHDHYDSTSPTYRDVPFHTYYERRLRDLASTYHLTVPNA